MENYTTTFDTARRTAYLTSTVADHCCIVIDYGTNRIYLHYNGKCERMAADSISPKEFEAMCRSFFDEAERNYSPKAMTFDYDQDNLKF